MPNYVLSFRGQPGRTPTADDEAAWGQGLGQLGAKIVDSGHRVGRARALPDSSTGAAATTGLTGYVVITADSFEAAVEVAKGCPGLNQGGGIEVGETIDA